MRHHNSWGHIYRTADKDLKELKIKINIFIPTTILVSSTIGKTIYY